MPKTVLGLFDKSAPIEEIVSAIEALGFPRNHIRTLKEPRTFDITGVMSFERFEFELDLRRALKTIGASEAETLGYLEGLQNGGSVVCATGSDEQVDAAAQLINARGAKGIEQTSNRELPLPYTHVRNMTPIRHGSHEAGRVRHSGGGACLFVW